MQNLVLCPGSRSAPLALAAGEFARIGRIKLFTCIDERSAAFLALGLSAALGKATVVVTTSGSAVAHLLPAAIEADRSCHPLLFLTADRPYRFKNCGANQTVNQEDFLRPVCRWCGEGPREGLHVFSQNDLRALVDRMWIYAHEFPGPVHLNIPLEEPLHASVSEQKEALSSWASSSLKREIVSNKFIETNKKTYQGDDFHLDPFSPGVVVVGPWRGCSEKLIAFQKSLRDWQALCGWPVFADPLSGVLNSQPGLIRNWELLLPKCLPLPEGGIQVMRLGPLPSSRNLEGWLQECGGTQLLITEGDSRKLDPLGLAIQFSQGFEAWCDYQLQKSPEYIEAISKEPSQFAKLWFDNDLVAEDILSKRILLEGALTEPSLAYWIPRLLPGKLPIMLAASSPVRDWLSFSGSEPLSRRCFGFRGASGIDGTLSLAMGLAFSLGRMILVCGDLALLHDSNGWLLANPSDPPLLVLLIDNGGGGIFQQLGIQACSKERFDELFAMPQHVDQISLADAHGIPHRQVSCLEDLEGALEWGLSRPGSALLRVCTNPSQDVELRQNLRQKLAEHVEIVSKRSFI